MAPTAFEIRAIDPAELAWWRARGADRFDHPLTVAVVEEAGDAPLRCCLAEGSLGARIALAAHRPFPHNGPYAEVGPVFVHAEPCSGYNPSDGYPEAFRHRTQVFRAYGHDQRIVGAEMVAGVEAEPAIERLFADPGVA